VGRGARSAGQLRPWRSRRRYIGPVAPANAPHRDMKRAGCSKLGCIDILQTDITESCGLLKAKNNRPRDGRRVYVTFAPHKTVVGPISTAACLQLAACTTNSKILEHQRLRSIRGFKEDAAAQGYPRSGRRLFRAAQRPRARDHDQRRFHTGHIRREKSLQSLQGRWHRPPAGVVRLCARDCIVFFRCRDRGGWELQTPLSVRWRVETCRALSGDRDCVDVKEALIRAGAVPPSKP